MWKWMYNQIARFVDHDDVIIFVNDIERNILRLEARLLIKEWILDQRVLVNGTIGDKPKEKVLGGERIAIDVHQDVQPDRAVC
jgi:hypothetical protein